MRSPASEPTSAVLPGGVLAHPAGRRRWTFYEIVHVARAAQRQKDWLLAVLILAQSLDVTVLPALAKTPSAVASPFMIFAASIVQKAYRRHSMRARMDDAVIRLQRWFRRNLVRPRISCPYVKRLEHQLVLLRTLSMSVGVLLESSAELSKPTWLSITNAICFIPVAVGLLTQRWNRQHVFRQQRWDPVLGGTAITATLKFIAMAFFKARDVEGYKKEAASELLMFSLRCIHLGVVNGLMMSNQLGRQVYWRALYSFHTGLIITMSSVMMANVLEESLLLTLSRGPVLFAFVTWATFMGTRAAKRLTVARENTMGDLRLALDTYGMSGGLAKLIDPAVIAREWTEGPLAHINAAVLGFTICILGVCTVLWGWMAQADDEPTPVSFISSGLTWLMLVGFFGGGVIVRLGRSEWNTFLFVKRVGRLIFFVNIMRVFVLFRDLHTELSTPSPLEGLSSGSRTKSESVCIGASDNAPHPIQYQEVHVEMLAEMIESLMAFTRGFMNALLPQSHRLRTISICMVAVKQLLGSILRNLHLAGQTTAVAAFVREISLALLGAATAHIGIHGALASWWQRGRLLEELEVNRRDQLQASATVALRASIALEGTAPVHEIVSSPDANGNHSLVEAHLDADHFSSGHEHEHALGGSVPAFEADSAPSQVVASASTPPPCCCAACSSTQEAVQPSQDATVLSDRVRLDLAASDAGPDIVGNLPGFSEQPELPLHALILGAAAAAVPDEHAYPPSFTSTRQVKQATRQLWKAYLSINQHVVGKLAATKHSHIALSSIHRAVNLHTHKSSSMQSLEGHRSNFGWTSTASQKVIPAVQSSRHSSTSSDSRRFAFETLRGRNPLQVGSGPV